MSHLNYHENAQGKSPRATQSKPKMSDDFFRALDMLPHCVWVSYEQGNYANTLFQQYLGYANQHISEQQWLKALHPEDAEHLLYLWQESQKTGQKIEKECRIANAENQYQWFLLIAQNHRFENIDYWMVTYTNIHERATKQRETADSLRAHTEMLDVSVDCIKIVRPDGTVSHMNRSGCRALLGKEREKNFGMKWLDLLPPEVREKGEVAIRAAVKGKNARFTGMSVSGQNTQYWDNILTPVVNEQGETLNILCLSRDITAQRVAEAKLRRSGEVDELTGLMNRRTFRRYFKKTMTQQRDKKQKMAFMLLDLDHFKKVNDTLGHAAGDHLLKVLSRRMSKILPENAYIARLGGDEFAVVVKSFQDQSELEHIAQQLLLQMEKQITYHGKHINCGMTIGCAIYPNDANDILTLMKCADTALNDLKEDGRGGLRMFGKAMFELNQQRTEQLITARMVIWEHRIEPFYQPKYNLETAQLIGFEALLRWKDESGEYRPPSELFEAFNDYEAASKISELMQTLIFQDLQAWKKKGLPLVPISINASPVEFMRDNYAEKFLRRLEAYQIPAELIEIEITEHTLAERGAEYVIRAIHKLKNAGILISLDDFGTGHSSLTHLRDYPVDNLKIDCAFIGRIHTDQSIYAIVEAIVKLGPILSLNIIAEGIETHEQFQTLKSLGCYAGQGYLFSKAVNQQSASGLLMEHDMIV